MLTSSTAFGDRAMEWIIFEFAASIVLIKIKTQLIDIEVFKPSVICIHFSFNLTNQILLQKISNRNVRYKCNQ